MVISIVVTMLVVTGVIAGLAGDDDAAPPGWAVPSAPAPPPATPAPLDAPEPTPSPTPSPAPALNLNAEVDVEVDGFFSWAALDRRTGERAGSRNQARTSSTESMIKVWIVADYLRRRRAGKRREAAAEAELAIRDSHNGTTESLYRAGGTNDVVERMIDMCGLTDTEIYPYWWNRRDLRRDVVRGEDADGTAAGRVDRLGAGADAEGARTTDPEDQPCPTAVGAAGASSTAAQVREARWRSKRLTAIGRTNSWHICAWPSPTLGDGADTCDREG